MKEQLQLGVEEQPQLKVKEQSQHTDCGNGDLSCQLIGYGIEGSTWSTKELQTTQENDRDVGPVMKWMKESKIRPPWQTVAPYNGITKAYWSQWGQSPVDGRGTIQTMGDPIW